MTLKTISDSRESRNEPRQLPHFEIVHRKQSPCTTRDPLS